MSKIQCKCKRCETKFEVYPCIIKKGGGKFCSRKCQNYKLGKYRKCCTCDKEFYISKAAFNRKGYNQGQFCSRKCKGKWQQLYSVREGNPNWKGGKCEWGGYIYIRINGTYIGKHRLVMEKMIGRFLKSPEIVHHINGKRDDNKPENLKLFTTIGEHLRFELTGRKSKLTPKQWVKIRKAQKQYFSKKRSHNDTGS